MARQDTVVDAMLATGQVEAIQSAELRAEVEGRIAEILMREGSEVAAGDGPLPDRRSGAPGRRWRAPRRSATSPNRR